MTVTREQMAAFLVRAFNYRSGMTLTDPESYFTDTESSGLSAAIAAAGAGFTGGFFDGTYQPT